MGAYLFPPRPAPVHRPVNELLRPMEIGKPYDFAAARRARVVSPPEFYRPARPVDRREASTPMWLPLLVLASLFIGTFALGLLAWAVRVAVTGR